MLAIRVGIVIRGKIVEKFHIGDERRTGETALKKIVTQKRVLGDPSGKSLFKCFDDIQPLAGVTSLPKRS